MNIADIGTVVSTRKRPADDHWDQESAFIELHSKFSEDSLLGITDFSHVEILFFMNLVDPNQIESTARHPRNNVHWPKIGIFSQRGKNRPNQIGVTVCEVLKVEGRRLYLKGLDAVDGTPVLDIKPWMDEFGPRGLVKQPEWSRALMKNYWAPGAVGSLPPSIFDPIFLDTEHVKIRPMHTVPWEMIADNILYEGSFHARMWGIRTHQDYKRVYEGARRSLANKSGNPVVFLNMAEDEVLGVTNFMNVEPVNGMIEIGGTWINPKYQRTYVNTETKFALLQYCFEILKLYRVEFRIDVDNKISQKAVERLGFRLDGMMPRRKVNANGDVRDYVFYSVTDRSWPEVKGTIQHLLARANTTQAAMDQVKQKNLRP